MSTAAAGSVGAAGPMSRVAVAMEEGVTARAAIAERTGLDVEMVDAVLDRMVQLGMVTAEALGGGCDSGGCGGCGSRGVCGGAPAATTAQRRGPVLLTLHRRHPR